MPNDVAERSLLPSLKVATAARCSLPRDVCHRSARVVQAHRGASMRPVRPDRLRSSKFAVLAVVAVATTCVWAAARRAFLARAKPLASSTAPLTGIPDLDAALRKSWMFSGGRGAFPYGEKGGKAGEPKVGDMSPEELRKAMGREERAPGGSAPSGGARVLPSAAEAALEGHCYSLHKPKLCPRKTKDDSRTAPDGSECTDPTEVS